jgi:hypothetical protein
MPCRFKVVHQDDIRLVLPFESSFDEGKWVAFRLDMECACDACEEGNGGAKTYTRDPKSTMRGKGGDDRWVFHDRERD